MRCFLSLVMSLVSWLVRVLGSQRSVLLWCVCCEICVIPNTILCNVVGRFNSVTRSLSMWTVVLLVMRTHQVELRTRPFHKWKTPCWTVSLRCIHSSLLLRNLRTHISGHCWALTHESSSMSCRWHLTMLRTWRATRNSALWTYCCCWWSTALDSHLHR